MNSGSGGSVPVRSAPTVPLPLSPAHGRFSRFVRRSHEQGGLVVQPRMGFADTATMRRGLEAVRAVRGASIGTVTVDSYTRVNDHESARRALDRGDDLNGYPVVAHGVQETRRLLTGVADDDFPVQFRHGSALPRELFGALARVGADATEGGPVSYCLPYSRVPLPQATAAWAECCRILADRPQTMHLESFGGCMLGQLCPPSLLIALSVLEGMFFREHGMRSISVSYAQQTSPEQDLEALAALRLLAAQWLGDDVDWHVVLYTYMGVFPRTPVGAYRMLEDSVRLAVRSGTERLIVKTAVEAYRIPTIEENVDALEFAAAVAADERQAAPTGGAVRQTGIYEEALQLITSTLRFGDDVGSALVGAFAHGYLDVPYCLHQDNANRSRAAIDPGGTLRWFDPGAMPVAASDGHGSAPVTARSLIDMLGYNERRFDREQLVGAAVRGML
ncbi:methylaspartate mutase [Streptomyces sp. NPDC056161]|uniref:methylaspartate mutase n=1 Tax=Streptomyces sp. NPDC056161 TaxID=3345732 RepID=UPI0035DC2F54